MGSWPAKAHAYDRGVLSGPVHQASCTGFCHVVAFVSLCAFCRVGTVIHSLAPCGCVGWGAERKIISTLLGVKADKVGQGSHTTILTSVRKETTAQRRVFILGGMPSLDNVMANSHHLSELLASVQLDHQSSRLLTTACLFHL